VNYHNAVHARWPKRARHCALLHPLWFRANQRKFFGRNRGNATRTRDLCCDSLAGIGFTATYKNAGTAKIPVRRTRLHELWVGLWVGKMARTLLSSYCESRPIESDLKLVRRPYCGVIHVSAWRRCLSQKCADKKMRVCGGYRKMTARIPVHSNRWLIPDVTPRIALSGNQ